MAVSFMQDIRPLFTGINIAHMKSFCVALDGSGYRRSSHARKVLDTVSREAPVR